MKVSISCITYNQEHFIRQTIDSILAQKVNFDYELLIYDDASTDNTSKIIKEYSEKYPNIVKPIYQTENQFSKGIDVGCKFNLPRAKGQYIALCDGDDYWIDPYKLQKQVDFLDKNLDYALCCHCAIAKYQNNDRKTQILPDNSIFSRDITYELLLETNFIVTSSVMYRLDKRVISALTNDVPKDILPYDWYTYFLIVNGQKIKLMKDVMSVYRINQGSIWTDWWYDRESFYLNCGLKYAKFFYYHWNNILKRDIKYKDMVMANIQPIFDCNLYHYNKEICESMKKMFPEFDFYNKSYNFSRNKDYRYMKRYQKLWVIFMILSILFAIISIVELII